MPESDTEAPAAAPVLYVTDLSFERYDPADLFDLAFLLRSPAHRLSGVCFANFEDREGGERVLNALVARHGGGSAAIAYPWDDGFQRALMQAEEPLNVVAVGGFWTIARVLARARGLFREKVARLFLVGGHVNTYAPTGRGTERVPIDPGLKERHPERFAPSGDPRLLDDIGEFATILTSGEGVIWLPRDICLWRYAAPQMLRDGGPLCEFLLRELFAANLPTSADRYAAADAPVLLSALPALLLAAQPDPFAWMRLFRAVTARVEAGENSQVASFVTRTDSPNLYTVIGIDGRSLSQLLSKRLRDRPLPGTE